MIETIFSEENLLPLNKIVIAKEVLQKLSPLSEKEQMAFRKKVQSHYIASCNHLLKKTVLKPEFMLLEKFRFMCPEEIKKDRSSSDMIDAASSLPLDISTDELNDEWKLLQCEDIEKNDDESIVNVWKPIFKMKLSTGELKYPNITKLIKHCFTLSHGNADVERSFSESGKILTPDKTRLDERTLNAKMNIKNELKLYNNKPQLVPITTELLAKARKAHSSYNAYLEEQKRKLEVEAEHEKQKLMAKQEEEENFKKLKIQRKNIDSLKEELKVNKTKLAEKRKAYDENFKLSQNKLKKATDVGGIEIAKALLNSAENLKNEEKALSVQNDKLQKQLLQKVEELTTSKKSITTRLLPLLLKSRFLIFVFMLCCFCIIVLYYFSIIYYK